VTFDVISDCEGSFATVREAFPGVDDDEPWWIPVNVVLLRTDDATLLVDTGAGPKPRAFFADGDARLLEELEQLSVAPADVDIVVHTHLHIDHVGWDGAFPNARYVVHEEDWAYFMSEESLAQRSRSARTCARRYCRSTWRGSRRRRRSRRESSCFRRPATRPAT